MARHRRMSFSALAALVAVAVASCGGSSANGSGTASVRQTLHVVYGVTTPDISTAPWLSAGNTGGFWSQMGLDVKVTGVNGASPALQLLANGQADAVYTGLPDFFPLKGTGAPDHIVASVYSTNHVYPVVLQDSPITTVEQFKGKRLCVLALAGNPYLMMQLLMQSHGMSMKDFSSVTPVGSGAPALALLQNHSCDVLAEWHGNYAVMEQQAGVHFRKFNTDPALKTYAFVQGYFFPDDTIKNKPDLVTKFLRGAAEGVIFSDQNPQAAAAGHYKMFPQSKATGVSEAEALKAGAAIIKENVQLSAPAAYKHQFGLASQAQVEAVRAALLDAGIMKTKLPWTDYYTDRFIKGANDFDVNAVIRQAKSAKVQS